MSKLFVLLLIFLFFLPAASAFPTGGGGGSGIATNESGPHQGQEMSIFMDENVSSPVMHKPVILQYLIEVGSESTFGDLILFRETLVFKNLGSSEYNDSFGVVIPSDAAEVTVYRVGHQPDGNLTPLGINRSGNDLLWMDSEPLAPNQFGMYAVEYVVPKTTGAASVYTKTLKDGTVDFPVGELLIKTGQLNTKAVFKSKTGVALNPDNTQIRDDGTVYSWSPPAFDEIVIETTQASADAQKTATPAGEGSNIVFYVAFGIVVILLLAYPMIKDKIKK